MRSSTSSRLHLPNPRRPTPAADARTRDPENRTSQMDIDWGHRFKEFAARKTSEATHAVIRPLTTEIENGSGLTEVGNRWSRALFDGSFYMSPEPSPALPSGSLVFVQSHDGNTGASDPS